MLSLAKVVFSKWLHTSTDVYFDLDCLSWVLHNRASSLLLLYTVLASLSVLVGDSEHQKLAYLLFSKEAYLMSCVYVDFVFFFIFVSTIKGLDIIFLI